MQFLLHLELKLDISIMESYLDFLKRKGIFLKEMHQAIAKHKALLKEKRKVDKNYGKVKKIR